MGLVVALALVLAALAQPQRRLGFHDMGSYELDCYDDTRPDELRALANAWSEESGWFEGSLLSPLGDVRAVFEVRAFPPDDLAWCGLYVDGVLVAEAAAEDGGIDLVDGQARVSLDAAVDPLWDRSFRIETVDGDGDLAYASYRIPSVTGEVWSDLDALEPLEPR